MSVVPLTEQTYRDMVGHIEAFLFGVNFLNERIINDAVQAAKDFYNNLNFELPKPIVSPDPPEEPKVEPTPEQKNLKIPLDFLASLKFGDLNQGGHRHRNFKGTLIHWNVPIKILTHTSSFSTSLFTWKNQKWLFSHSKKFSSLSQVHTFVNQQKHSWGASYVLEFGSTSKSFFLILEHT